MNINTTTMEAPSTEHSNPFFMFGVSQVCATCTNQLETGRYYSLDTLVNQTDNVNLIHVLVSLCQFKSEENGPSNMCRECFYKTLLFYEFHQLCKNSVMLFDKYVEWQKQFLKPDIVDLGIYDTDAISTNVEEEQDENLSIDIEETVISEAISTNVEEEQDVEPTIDLEEPVISETMSTNEEEEQDVKLTIDIEETVISEGTLVNTNDDFNSLREVEGVESVISCSNESTKLNVLKEKSKQNKLYKCTKCDATYNNPKSLVHHTNLHTNKYARSYCGKANGSSVQLKLREKIHTGQPPYPCLVYICKICDKQFLSNSLLTQHQSIHIQERPSNTGQPPYPCLVYICKICDKRFLSNALLTQHQSIHIQERPFKGKVCEATFKARSVLEQHMKNHKRLKCTVCNKMFIWSSDLKRHLQTHEKVADKGENEESISLDSNSSSQHEETNQQTRESNMLEEESKQDNLYKCRKCDATFKLYSSFLSHHNIHKKRFVCSHCGKPWPSQSELGRHERTHTGERPFVCGKCGQRFKLNETLKKHLVTHAEKRIHIFNKPLMPLEGVGIKH